jgi:ribosomal protein S18 acetylase RimI-like enzyme
MRRNTCYAMALSNMDTLRVRPLTAADTAALLAFYHSLPEAVTRFFLPFGVVVTEEALRAHLEGAEAGRNVSLGLVGEAGEIQGHAFLQGVDTERPVFGIGLRERLLGQGWGRRLMRQALEEGDALGLPKTTLTVVKANRRALALYEKMGFAIRGECAFRAPGDSWYMERVRPA